MQMYTFKRTKHYTNSYLQDFLRIVDGRLQQLSKVLVFRLILVSQLLPCGDGLSKVNNLKITATYK